MIAKVLFIGTLVIAALGQEQSVFRSDTRLVEVEVVVRDGKGPVRGLTQSDFQVFDNGKLQKVSTFGVVTSKSSVTTAGSAAPVLGSSEVARHAESPVTATVLFINNLAIEFSDQVQAERRVAEIFHKLPPREPIAVYVLNQKLRILTDFTDDPIRVAAALDAAWGEQAQPGAGAWCIPPAYPALEKMANELGGLPGRKNLIWFANFFPVSHPADNAPCAALAYFAMLRAIKALNTANVAVYPIRATGVYGPPAYSAARSKAPLVAPGFNPSQGTSGLDGMFWADNTGGVAAQNTDVGFATLRAMDDSAVIYSLGFYADALDGKYHDLKVHVARKGVEVRSRVGYLASAPVDLSAKATANASMQASYVYTGTDRARVRLAVDVVPSEMVFQKKGDRFHGEMNVVGAALHADGSEAGRFEETVKVEMDSQERTDAFTRTPFHYEHEFALLAGNYVFQLKVGSERVSAPLNIERWHEDEFGMGGIAFCVEGADGNLSAGGRTFAMTGGNRFRPDERVYFYTEIYGSALALEYRVVDRNTGEVKKDSGMAGIGGYVRPGSPVVPFATALPVGGLGVGSYRLEVRASHAFVGSDASRHGPDVVMRSVDFEVR